LKKNFFFVPSLKGVFKCVRKFPKKRLTAEIEVLKVASQSSSRTQQNFNDKRPKGLKTNAAAFGTLRGALKESRGAEFFRL